jgi:DUF2939 family protein
MLTAVRTRVGVVRASRALVLEGRMMGRTPQWRVFRWTALGIVLLALFYAAYPYWTLYRLDQALETHDTQRLEAMIDWPSLRRNFRDDVLAAATARLLPNDADAAHRFGADLVTAWGTTLIDAAARGLLTSETLATLYDERRRAGASSLLHAIRFAFFRSPTSFDVDVETGRDDRLRFEMTLESGAWRVTRLVR